MGSFGSISLANKFGIVLGSLIVISFGAGLIKLWIIKRRLRHHVKLDEESARKPQKEKSHAGRENDPRYLFGVRALEKGHFGGVAQTSRPNSLSPSGGDSISNPSMTSVVDSNLKHQSSLSLALKQNPTKRKPSHLRLQPSDAQLNGPKTHSPTSPGSRYVVSPMTPPVPVSWSMPVIQEPKQEQFGLSIPTATADPARPKSYLPRLDFSAPLVDPLERSFLTSTPSSSVRGRRSNRGSATTGISIPVPVSKSPKKSPLYGPFPSIPIPPRSKSRPQRSMSPRRHEKEFPTAKRADISNSIPVPPIPATYDSHNRRGLGARESSDEDSGYGSTIQKSYAKRKSSDAISLAALTGNSIVSSFPKFEEEPTTNAASVDLPSVDLPSRGRNPISTPHVRQTSLGRTHDSLRHASRKISRERSASNRRSKQRDQMHYDPTSHHRNRSGSIQGRAVDFSKPRESPFADSAAISKYTHSPSSSTSSENSIISYYTTSKPEIPKTFDLVTLEKKRSNGETHFPESGGNKLRHTRDNFGTGHIERYAAEQRASKLRDTEVSIPRSATATATGVAVVKVSRMKPTRVSSHDGDFLMPGISSLETPSTSTSPVVEERFPKRPGWDVEQF